MSDRSRPGEVLRELGAFEQLANGYNRDEPFQHSLVLHLDRVLSVAVLQAALEVVRRAHPLLAARVDRSGYGGVPVFRSDDTPVTVAESRPGTGWEDVAAAEQVNRLDDAHGPLLRATRVVRGDNCSLVLTFPHQVVDGIGAVQVIRDLLSALNGNPVTTHGVPAPQERAVLDTVTEPGPGSGDAAPDGGSAGVRRRGPARSRRRTDGTHPHVHARALDVTATLALTDAAHAHGASVTGALLAAVAGELRSTPDEPVRVVVPIDLRRAAGLPDVVANRILAPQVALATEAPGDLWARARDASRELRRLRGPRLLRDPVTQLAAGAPYSPEAALAAFTLFLSADVELSNLGVIDLPGGPAVVATGVDGPVLDTRIEGQDVIGAVTVEGRLRLVLLTHQPDSGLLDRITHALTGAC